MRPPPVLAPHATLARRGLARASAVPEWRAGRRVACSSPVTTLSPEHMHVVWRRRLRLPLPLTQQRCGGDGQPDCGRGADVLGDHRVSCLHSGLLARRALAVEHACEAVGPEGRVVPQRWLRLDLVVYGATERGEELCCDATLVSPVRSYGRPHAGAADREDAEN